MPWYHGEEGALFMKRGQKDENRWGDREACQVCTRKTFPKTIDWGIERN